LLAGPSGGRGENERYIRKDTDMMKLVKVAAVLGLAVFIGSRVIG
jgi:hypothetical protein